MINRLARIEKINGISSCKKNETLEINKFAGIKILVKK